MDSGWGARISYGGQAPFPLLAPALLFRVLVYAVQSENGVFIATFIVHVPHHC